MRHTFDGVDVGTVTINIAKPGGGLNGDATLCIGSGIRQRGRAGKPSEYTYVGWYSAVAASGVVSEATAG
jgi:hypothetical protein